MQFRHYLAAVALAATTCAHSQEVDALLDIQPVAIESTIIAEVSDPPKRTLPSFLTDRQASLLEQAFAIAREDNHDHPELLQGILMVESRAGAGNYKSAKNNCFGIFQIKIGTAKNVLRNFPELGEKFGVNPKDDRVLKKKLMDDDAFNTSVASKYVLILKRFGYDTIRQLALAYNQGEGGAKRKNPQTHEYPNLVMKHLAKLGL